MREATTLAVWHGLRFVSLMQGGVVSVELEREKLYSKETQLPLKKTEKHWPFAVSSCWNLTVRYFSPDRKEAVCLTTIFGSFVPDQNVNSTYIAVSKGMLY